MFHLHRVRLVSPAIVNPILLVIFDGLGVDRVSLAEVRAHVSDGDLHLHLHRVAALAYAEHVRLITQVIRGVVVRDHDLKRVTHTANEGPLQRTLGYFWIGLLADIHHFKSPCVLVFVVQNISTLLTRQRGGKWKR
ncbi:hypothetical protein HSE3_gp064 [Klebsiella phage vB_KleS-HSE3]|nr:hypothetical protein HSE3_gp064 [Klebsiella phage vB_KleS-HSE3]